MIFVSCPAAFEPLLEEELKRLGIEDVRRGYCGMFVPQKMEYVYLINYASRLGTRVLWPLLSFYCRDGRDLYAEARKIDWSSLLTLKNTFAIDANVFDNESITNSLYAAQVVKDALCDTFAAKFRSRPSVNVAAPDVQFNLFVHKERATISLDTSKEALFKRGYREHLTEAPLKESLAAAILTLAGYSASDLFCDPFCGSGTFLMEAAMMATKTPSGYFRKSWGFLRHPLYREEEWKAVKEREDAKRVPLEKGKIFGSDRDPKAIAICRAQLKKTGFEEAINVQIKGVSTYRPPAAPSLFITNPPYGKRLECSIEDIHSYGYLIRKNPAARAYILANTRSLAQSTGLAIKDEWKLKNGGLDVSLFSLDASNPAT